MDRNAIISQVNGQLFSEFGGTVRLDGFSLTGTTVDAVARTPREQWQTARATAAQRGGDKPATHATLQARTAVLVIDAMTAE